MTIQAVQTINKAVTEMLDRTLLGLSRYLINIGLW